MPEAQIVTLDEVRKRLQAIEELPALPTIIAEINELLSNPKTTAPQLAQIIMKDPTITAKLLKIVNSAFFGMPKTITSVNQAIVALGFNTVRSVVLCSAVMDMFSKSKLSEVTFQRKDFWMFSVAVAASARVVARNAGVKATETMFVAGLLHGVGKIVMDEYFHELFAASFLKARSESMTLWEAQRQVCGFTDAQVGGVLLELWKLSPVLINSVTFQEAPIEAPEEDRANAAFVLVGNVIARVCGLGNPGDIALPRITPESMQVGSVEEVQWMRLFELSIDAAKKASVFFEP
ncbi:MAG: HDOD domain-containing protein [Planctomycetes bacterium]|nr:HDOD domain-containing protein [Planctomycetota bacterium]